MAKPTAKKTATPSRPTQKSNVPARVENKSGANALVNADDEAFLANYAGSGVSQAAEDNVIPLVYLLQSNSPQVNKRGEAYVEGAEPGFIWLRGTPTVFNGEDGIYAQPCHFRKAWIQWGPQRGDGYKGRHETPNDSKLPPAGAVEKEVMSEGKLKKQWVMPNGDIVVQVREHAVRLFTRNGDKFEYIGQYLISMSGTNHTSSRNWMMMMNGKVVPVGGAARIAPSFGYMYLLTSKFRKNDAGEWFMWEASEDEFCGQLLPRAELEAGLKMFTAFNTNALRGDNPDDAIDNGGEDGGDNSDM